MARSRALDAREPGQIREEAALSGSAQAPRVSLAGARSRRERPGTGFDEGCTVHFFLHATLIRDSACAKAGRAFCRRVQRTEARVPLPLAGLGFPRVSP